MSSKSNRSNCVLNKMPLRARLSESKRMKILFVGGFDLPSNNAAAQRVCALASTLAEVNFEIDLVGLSSNSEDVSEFTSLQGVGRYLNLDYPRSLVDWLSYLTSIRRIEHKVNLSDYDAVVAYNFPFVPLALLSFKRKNRNFVLVSDITEWYDVNSSSIVFRIIKGMDVFFRMQLAGVLSDSLIVVSRFLKRFYKNTSSIVIPTLVLDDNVSQLSINTNDEIRFIYAGIPFSRRDKNTVHLKDRIDLVVKYFLDQQATGWRLDIYGVSLDDFCSTFGYDLEAIDSKKIKFHGRVQRSVVLDAFKKADYSIFIRDNKRSNWAGFPTKLSESFSMGVPVVTNDVGDSKLYINNSRGVVLEGDGQNFKDQISNLINLGKGKANEYKANLRSHNPLAIEAWKSMIIDYFNGLVRK